MNSTMNMRCHCVDGKIEDPCNMSGSFVILLEIMSKVYSTTLVGITNLGDLGDTNDINLLVNFMLKSGKCTFLSAVQRRMFLFLTRNNQAFEIFIVWYNYVMISFCK